MWELYYKESLVPKNWCFWTVVLEKTVKSPMHYKEIQPVNPEGNQCWIFIGRTDVEAEAPILWPPEVENWLTGKNPDGKDWRQEEKGRTEDEMVGWHHWLDVHDLEQIPEVSDGQGGLVCCSPWVANSWTRLSDWTELMVSLLCKTETLCSTDIVGGGPKKSEGMGGETGKPSTRVQELPRKYKMFFNPTSPLHPAPSSPSFLQPHTWYGLNFLLCWCVTYIFWQKSVLLDISP